jgi:hypothetical protein
MYMRQSSQSKTKTIKMPMTKLAIVSSINVLIEMSLRLEIAIRYIA